MYPDDVLLKNIQIKFCYNVDLRKLQKILFPDVKMKHIKIISVVSKDRKKTIFNLNMYPDDVLLQNIEIKFCYNIDLKKL